jgi:hypothetical protein
MTTTANQPMLWPQRRHGWLQGADFRRAYQD